MSEISDMIQRLCPDGVEYQLNKREIVNFGAKYLENSGWGVTLQYILLLTSNVMKTIKL